MDDPQTFSIKIGLALRLGVTDWLGVRGSFSPFLNLSLFLFVAISYVAVTDRLKDLVTEQIHEYKEDLNNRLSNIDTSCEIRSANVSPV